VLGAGVGKQSIFQRERKKARKLPSLAPAECRKRALEPKDLGTAEQHIA